MIVIVCGSGYVPGAGLKTGVPATGMTRMVALADFDPSWTLVAVMVTVSGPVTFGAV